MANLFNFNCILNYELFIAKRIIFKRKNKKSVGTPIIKIAIAAIAMGMAMMLIATSTGVGLQRKIRDKIAVFRGHIQITSLEREFENNTVKPIDKNQPFYPTFKNIPNVKKLQRFATKTGIIRTEKNFEGVTLKGVDLDYDWKRFSQYLVKGTLPVFSEEKISPQVLISQILSNRLGLYINDTFDMYFVKKDPLKSPNRRIFKIVGIYDTGFEEFDKLYLLGDIKQVQRLNKWKKNQIGGFEVLIKDIEKAKETNNAIYKNIPTQLDSQSLFEMHPMIFQWLQMFDSNIFVIIGIMIIVASINMITALLVMILERTQTIGILKTLGSSNRSIRKIFLYNATYLIFKGLLWGNAIGLILIGLQKYFSIIRLDPSVYYVNKAPVYIHFWHIMGLNAGTVVLCFLSLIAPSYIITKISPAKAITFS